MSRWKVPLNKPFFSNETKELVMNVLNSGMVSQGEMVGQFEEDVHKNSARLARTTLALPIWPEMTLEDIDLVINTLEEALA